ncbi:MAG TPA: hypothetical protein VHK28_06920 [Candidatus Limnocylindria bacterium]|nr:hypothetical protein [Candidatus Limnocylindria bacterium]
MDPNVVFPFLSSLLSFIFAVLVADQWLRRRQSYQLVWTVGLLWYGISAGTEFIGGAWGWDEPLYRTWYLVGAFGVAAYLGLGTVYLLRNTRFGYFVAFSVFAGGLFSILSAVARAREGDPTSAGVVPAVLAFATLAAVAIAVATRIHRPLAATVSAVVLVLASVVVTYLTLTVPVSPPGFFLDPATGVPTGEALPSDLRVLTPPFNIAGAFALVFGAFYSAYIFMPKRRVMRVETQLPVVGAVGRAVAVVVNFFASIPGAVRAFGEGRLNSRVPATLLIALGGFIPGWTSGLNRFGITWSFYLGEFAGVLLIFLGFLVSIEVFSDIRLPFTNVVLARRDRKARSETEASADT